MKRLKATKAIFNGNLQTTANLLRRTDAQITADYHKLNIIRGALLRTTQEKTLKITKQKLEILATEMGHALPTKHSREHLLNKVKTYKKQNSYLRYAATHQAVIKICVVYEDLIRRIILKYHEEDIRRIPAGKETLKNEAIVKALLQKESIHRLMAEKVADDLMYGSLDAWHKALIKFGMTNTQTSSTLTELFLIRNCFVHNNKKVSPQLHTFSPQKYKLRSSIHLSVADVEIFKDEVYKSAVIIMSEYNRAFPKNRGSWI